MDNPSSKRVLAIVLGEAPWTWIDDPDFAAHVPALRSLAAKGIRGDMLAPHPLDADALWATLVTGRSPSGHGVFGPWRAEALGRSRRVSVDDLAAPPFWEALEGAGKPVGIFNVSLANPSKTLPTSGFMVSRDGMRAIHQDLVHPPELYSSLLERHGRWNTGAGTLSMKDWTERVPVEIDTRGRILVELLETRPWSFALVHMIDIARAQHRFCGDEGGKLEQIYAAVDRTIGELVTRFGSDTLFFLFSECGAGPIRYGVHLDAWLKQRGVLHRRRGLGRGLGLGIARLHKRMRGILPKSIDLSKAKARVRTAITASNIDWSRTRAFSPGDTSEILFNVPEGERSALTEELRTALLELRDPDGRRAVENVITRQDWNSHWPFTPDLTIVWEDDAYMPIDTFEDDDQVFVPWCPEFPNWALTGSHRRHGMLLVSGPGIDRADLRTVKLVDLVPTWLELLGLEIGPELEGSSFASKLPGARIRSSPR